MKTEEELLKMLRSRLDKLKNGFIKKQAPETAKHIAHDIELLCHIIGKENIPKDYWEEIEEETMWYYKNIEI